MTSSVLTLLTISWDRYHGIVSYRVITKKKKIVLLICIWSLSVLFSVPLTLVKKQIFIQWEGITVPQCVEEWPLSYAYFNDYTKSCYYYEPLRISYYVLSSVVLFFIPLVIMFLLYIKIYRSSRTTVTEQKWKATRMMFYVLVAFIFCWTPLHFLMIYIVLNKEAKTNKPLPSALGEFGWIVNYTAYANGVIYPVILGGLFKKYREGFGYILSLLLECQCFSILLKHFRRLRGRSYLEKEDYEDDDEDDEEEDEYEEDEEEEEEADYDEEDDDNDDD